MGVTAGASPLGLQLALTHRLCHCGLQSDRMACEKRAVQGATLPWSGRLVNRVPLLALPEMALQAVNDRCRSPGRFGIGADQTRHPACRVGRVLLLFAPL